MRIDGSQGDLQSSKGVAPPNYTPYPPMFYSKPWIENYIQEYRQEPPGNVARETGMYMMAFLTMGRYVPGFKTNEVVDPIAGPQHGKSYSGEQVFQDIYSHYYEAMTTSNHGDAATYLADLKDFFSKAFSAAITSFPANSEYTTMLKGINDIIPKLTDGSGNPNVAEQNDYMNQLASLLSSSCPTA